MLPEAPVAADAVRAQRVVDDGLRVHARVPIRDGGRVVREQAPRDARLRDVEDVRASEERLARAERRERAFQDARAVAELRRGERRGTDEETRVSDEHWCANYLCVE